MPQAQSDELSPQDQVLEALRPVIFRFRGNKEALRQIILTMLLASVTAARDTGMNFASLQLTVREFWDSGKRVLS